MDLIFSYTLASLIGISLGLIGGGGAILTVPILVYVAGINPMLSTSYSLFVVGTTSLVGAINNARKGLVSFKTALVFAIPSFTIAYITRLYVMPFIPEEIIHIGTFILKKNIVIMVFFAIIMVIASTSMIRAGNDEEENGHFNNHSFNLPRLILQGMMVGVMTGIVGAGGGFLIIPALVLLARLPMKLAVGTSLLIIASNSLIGFMGDLQVGVSIHWGFLLIFASSAVIGIFLGGYLSHFISGNKLKASFGWFVLVMGIYIIIKELFFHKH